MLPENDLLISKLTVKISNPSTSQVLGTGMLFNADNLGDNLYILTAAHCLFKDSDNFTDPYGQVVLEIYNQNASYTKFLCPVNLDLVLKERNRDVAVIVMDKNLVVRQVGEIPPVTAVKERATNAGYISKGFPRATMGLELDSLQPIWKQHMPDVNKFQLSLTEDYDQSSVAGFSGSGIFLHVNNALYLFGIFTRFRPEGRGKTIYCQYLETVNDILRENFLPELTFSFLGSHGLDQFFFRAHIRKAVLDLGPRFDQKLNFRTPNAKLFDAMAKDEMLHEHLHKLVDDWVDRAGSAHIPDKPLTSALRQQLENTIRCSVDWWQKIIWAADESIDTKDLLTQMDATASLAEQTLTELYKSREELEKDKTHEQIQRGIHRPYDNEIYYVQQLTQNISTFREGLDNLYLELTNHPFLIIKGEAGAGKSHLLGDIASKRMQVNKPTLLLLGQKFRASLSLWENIGSQLETSMDKAELLESLNQIGRQAGSRLLILIDALNEGDGKQLWPASLAGFLDEIKRYPFIGVVLTVRTTYWKTIIPESIDADKDIAKISHEGFKGNEYAALKLFCLHYGLTQPGFPILAPEFSNPLFLRIICEGLKNSGQTAFPEGFHGFTQVFKYYVKSVAATFALKREEYALRPTLVETAIYKMAELSFGKDSQVVTVTNAVALFDQEFAGFSLLLNDLINESVFIKTMANEHASGNDVEYIYFSYERFGDFAIAERLLSAFPDVAALQEQMPHEPFFATLLQNHNFFYNRGIIEALAVILPEKYDIELFEAMSWLERGNVSEHQMWAISRDIDYYVLDSLKWRVVSSIRLPKLRNWMHSEGFSIGDPELLYRITELSAIPGHPFNSDWMHRLLSRKTMASRDSFWQSFLLSYRGGDDESNPTTVERIIDWAWQDDIATKAESETARLVGQTLAWFLASTIPTLRDRATKAMVNLLWCHGNALLSIMKRFRGIDDLYVLERLYAVAYGCALRMNDQDLTALARFTYNEIFKNGQPPLNILLRDYARQVIEYALHRGLKLKVDVVKFRPPYNTPLPEQFPTAEDIACFKTNTELPDQDMNIARVAGRIHFDTMDWDFGKKEVVPAFDMFSNVRFTIDREFKEQYKRLKPTQKELIKIIKELIKIDVTLADPAVKRKLQYYNLQHLVTNDLESFTSKFAATITVEQQSFFIDKWMPNQRAKSKKPSWGDELDSIPFRRYIVKRAFQLGFSMELHGEYDSRIIRHSFYESFVNRIGEKYQRIAFSEALCMAADNYCLAERRRFGKTDTYDGPWEGYLRDVDPSFITRRQDNSWYSEKYSEDIAKEHREWWQSPKYQYWNYPPSEWVNIKHDLPALSQVVKRSDGKTDWLYLNVDVRWAERKPIGESKLGGGRKDLRYFIDAYLIKKADKAKILAALRKGSTLEDHMPNSNTPSGLFNRENYWSAASIYHFGITDKWYNLGGLGCKATPTTHIAVGEMSDDKSGAHFQYRMPSRIIFEGMKMRYGRRDGDFLDMQGEVVASNENPHGTMIAKQPFLTFLEQNDLQVVWCLSGEKMVFDLNNMEASYFKMIRGVYTFDEDGNLQGDTQLLDRQ